MGRVVAATLVVIIFSRSVWYLRRGDEYVIVFRLYFFVVLCIFAYTRLVGVVGGISYLSRSLFWVGVFLFGLVIGFRYFYRSVVRLFV